MLKIEKSFYDVIDIAKELLGPRTDRDNVNQEYQRAVLELVAWLTIGTEENARQFLADELGVDHEVGSHPATSTDIVIGVDTLLERAGPLTAAQVARLAAALPHSSVPDAVGEIAASVRDGGDNGRYRRTPFRSDDATTLRASERSERTEGRAASVSEHGDVGGDNQAGPKTFRASERSERTEGLPCRAQRGPAHSLSWQRRLADGTFETLTLYHYAAQQDVEPSETDPEDERSVWVETMVELVRHRDASDPGGTEITSDYRYESSNSFGTLGDALEDARRYTSDNEAIDPHDLWWQI